MHGCGPKVGAPASDVAGRRRPCVRAASDRVVPRGKSRIGLTRADAAEVGADSAEIGTDAAKIGPTRSVSAVSACIGRNGRVRPKFQKKKEKKKKKVEVIG